MMTLAQILSGIEQGRFPAPDAGVTVVPAPSSGATAAVLALTGHHVIAADVDPAWVAERIPERDLTAPMNPPFLRAMEELTGRRVNAVDAMLVAEAITDPAEREASVAGLVEVTDRDHPRVRRALRYRDDVRVHTEDNGGVVIIGRGLAGRLECAVEVPEDRHGNGEGRRLARAVRALIPAPYVWAQITPGNAASLRAFLAAGFRPVGSEALLVD